MTRLEQRLTELLKALSTANQRGDIEEIENLEDEIAEVEFEIEEEYSKQYNGYGEDF